MVQKGIIFAFITTVSVFFYKDNIYQKKISIKKTQEMIKKLDDAFFKDNCPKDIKISIEDCCHERGALYDKEKKEIKVSNRLQQKERNMVLFHEITHICLGQLTNKNNAKQEFRFFDEGFANIMSSQMNNNISIYKEKTIKKTKEQIKLNNVSFEKAQKWNIYFGTWENQNPKNWSAYNVGSSFVFFIIDNYSKEKLYEFYVSIGKTSNLEKSIFNVFNKKQNDFEKEWIQYVIKQSDIK